jgi:hypothetical protein
MSKKQSGFSLRTADATSGGGIEGATATISEIGFVGEFTYGGRQKDKPQAALRVEYTIDGFDKPWEQNYTLGPAEKYEVVSDGDGIISTGKQSGLNKKCSAFAFFSALETAAEEGGLDLDDLLPSEDGVQSVRPLEGRTVRLTNAKFETVSGDTKDLPVIGAFEGDAAPKKGKSKSNGKAKGGDIEGDTEAAVLALLEDAGKPIKQTALSNDIYAANRKNPNAKAMMELGFKKSWVFDDARPWDSDTKKGTIAAREED